MIKCCALCQKNNEFDGMVPSSKFTRPRKEEEKAYFDLWHRVVEVCPDCGYASYDISKCDNKNIINAPNYKNIEDMDIVVELNNYVPNRLTFLLQAALYYNSIKDRFNEALAYLQASDTICGVVNRLLLEFDFGDDEDNKLLKCADVFYEKALQIFEELLSNNTDNVELYIIYGGALLDGNDLQEKKGLKVLREALNHNTTPLENKIIKYLLKI